MSKFQPIGFYKKSQPGSYRLLPFRFTALDTETYVATNLAGEFLTLERPDLENLVNHKLDPDGDVYHDLRARHFLTDNNSNIATKLLAIKLRSRYRYLPEFTGLHMFVATLRCEHSCPYCQVSRQSHDRLRYDMTEEIADKALDLVFQSPSKAIKIEFQGGEPLLNFSIVEHVVRRAEQINRNKEKDLAFVIATNLALVDDQMLGFCKDHFICISTSLDGPRDLHNANRPRPGKDSYERAILGVKMVREALGRDQVSALMTTTAASLGRVKDIVDEYVAQGFEGIFLRPLSPYGFAIKTKTYFGYDVDKWLAFYKEGLRYIIELNRKGIKLSEYYAQVILRKMLTFDDSRYVDLMSPAGIGIAGVVYNYNGDVFASDEGRMLAETGDPKFRIGNVFSDSYEGIFGCENLMDALEQTFTKSVPMCSQCAFEDYCGADPVFHWAAQNDLVGRKPESQFCSKNMEIFRFLIATMKEDRFAERLFLEWAT